MKLPPNTLRQLTRERTHRALDCGALQPIQTEQIFIQDHGIDFAIRIVSSLARKETARKLAPQQPAGDKPFNPFLPYDKNLFVADLSQTHICLLNKFKVIDEHLLLVTRHFEDQETLLTRADFQALWTCLTQFDSLGFYNGGPAAGASQPHKHLQLVPLPLCQPNLQTPIAPLLHHARLKDGIGFLPGFPFLHRVATLDPTTDPSTAATQAHQRYLTLLEQATGGCPKLPLPDPHRDPHRQGGSLSANSDDATDHEADQDLHLRPAPMSSSLRDRQPAPYNLLVTREWMLLVPRCQECFHDISINALGFAGSLFVKDKTALQTLQTHGPMHALQAVVNC